MYKSLTSVLLLSGMAHGFVCPRPQTVLPSSSLAAKGFGTKEESSPKPAKKKAPTPIAAEPTMKKVEEEKIDPFPEQNTDLSLGKAALEQMRRERAEKRNEQLRKLKEVQEVDAMLRETPGAGAIPEKVAQRMGGRMLAFVGFPLFGSMAAFVGFWYMATYRDMEFQPALVAASTIAFLALGLVGITYSIMSTSWDADREGSFLGTDEFARNLENIKEGLSRSKENAVLRDKVNDFSPQELAMMEQKEAYKEKRQKSFSEKLEDEVE